MSYQTSAPRISALRLPAQSAPVDRSGTQTSANGDGPGVDAAWSLGGILKKALPTVLDVASQFV
jgi:hypothetical protein